MMRFSRKLTAKTFCQMLIVAFVITVLLAFQGCDNDDIDAPCKRCDYYYTWDSSGNLDHIDEDCRAIDCAYANCEACVNITRNSENYPLSGTCDKCECPEGQIHCNDLTTGSGRCINPNTDRQHCGECDNACDEGENCVNGECQ